MPPSGAVKPTSPGLSLFDDGDEELSNPFYTEDVKGAVAPEDGADRVCALWRIH